MSILLLTFVLVVCAVVLLYPFVVRRNRHDGLDDIAEEMVRRLRRSRDRVYEEIRALQQERFLGNLTDEEYQRQLAAARMEAANLMRQQQEVQQTLAEIEGAVEEEIQLAMAAHEEEKG